MLVITVAVWTTRATSSEPHIAPVSECVIIAHRNTHQTLNSLCSHILVSRGLIYIYTLYTYINIYKIMIINHNIQIKQIIYNFIYNVFKLALAIRIFNQNQSIVYIIYYSFYDLIVFKSCFFVVLYFFPGNDDMLNPENDTIGILVSTAVDITIGSRNIKPAGTIKAPDKITNRVHMEAF